MFHSARKLWIAGVLVAVASLSARPALTADPKPAADDKASVTTAVPEAELTPDERAERDARKACKVAICAAFRGKGRQDGDIACDIRKSWRKVQLEKIANKAKMSWRYGAVRCQTALRLKRDAIVKSMRDDKAEIVLDTHNVTCTIDREKDEAADIKFDFAPKIGFEKGKAVKVALNWGKVEGPTFVKAVLWTAMGADNSLGLLSGMLAEDVNDFIDKKCDEVKDEWAAAK